MYATKLFISSVFCCLTCMINAQKVAPEISEGFKSGNGVVIGKYFAETVDVYVAGSAKTNLTKTLAIAELNQFFKNFPTKNFSIIHNGERDNSCYVIGKLISSEEFRVTIFLKKFGNNYLINQVKIEKG